MQDFLDIIQRNGHSTSTLNIDILGLSPVTTIQRYPHGLSTG